MKKHSVLTLVICALLGIAASARADVYILTKGSSCTGNTIIKGGVNQPFPMEQFTESLRTGKRLIAMGYTRLSGWVLSMADGTGIRLQHVSLTPEWPAEWIESEWSEGYQVSAIGHSEGLWCVVTSLNCGLSNQVFKTGLWEELRPFIREQWNGCDRRITSMCSDGANSWAIVMSFSDENTGQRYDFKNNWKRMEPVVDEYFANNYYISCISYGARNVGVVFNLGDDDAAPRQVCVTDPMSVQEYIDNGYVLTQIGNDL